MADGLDTLHRAGIAHGDVKPGNCLVVEQEGEDEPAAGTPTSISSTTPQAGPAPSTSVAWCDFGFSVPLPPGDYDAVVGVGRTVRGTPAYCDPCVPTTGFLGFPTDIYALGVTYNKILAGAVMMSNDAVGGEAVPGGVRELVEMMVCEDPGARPQAWQVAAHLRRVKTEWEQAHPQQVLRPQPQPQLQPQEPGIVTVQAPMQLLTAVPQRDKAPLHLHADDTAVQQEVSLPRPQRQWQLQELEAAWLAPAAAAPTTSGANPSNGGSSSDCSSGSSAAAGSTMQSCSATSSGLDSGRSTPPLAVDLNLHEQQARLHALLSKAFAVTAPPQCSLANGCSGFASASSGGSSSGGDASGGHCSPALSTTTSSAPRPLQ